MKTVTFFNGHDTETATGILRKLSNKRFVLTTSDEGWEIDLHKSDIISIEKSK